MTAKKQAPTSEIDNAGSFQRLLLQRLVQFTEETARTSSPEAQVNMPVTIIVDGQVLVGYMISYFEYAQKAMRSFESVLIHTIKISGNPPTSAISLFDQEIKKIESYKSTTAAPTGHLWLKNVRVNGSLGKDVIVPEHVAEVPFERIAVFWIGHAL